jgi:hypothetical protein
MRAPAGGPNPGARSVMKRQALFLATWAGRWTFMAAALVGAFVLIVGAWLWDASLLTRAADENLRFIKEITRLLPFSGPTGRCCWSRRWPSPNS